MSTSGTRCDNIIIQAVFNAFNCIIHITESDINKPDGTVITPVLCQEQPNTLYLLGILMSYTMFHQCQTRQVKTKVSLEAI